MPHRTPSPETLRKRNTVTIGTERVGNITSTDIPGHYPGEDHTWSIDRFRDGLGVDIHKLESQEAVFSLTGLDASLANAFRRILLSELPTLAIEDVFIRQNTSLIQDEVLAHRLGLIPLKASRAGLKWLQHRKRVTEDEPDADSATDHNTIQLSLQIKSEWREGGRELAKRGETDPEVLFSNTRVYARDIQFHTVGEQNKRFAGDAAVRSTNPDILIAKLRPGNELDITMHAVMGLGRDHAKFSPVATASYRLLPTIELSRPIVGQDARKFARCFPRGVIGLEPVTGGAEIRRQLLKDSGQLQRNHENDDVDHDDDEDSAVEAADIQAVVLDTMKDTVSRECLRYPEFVSRVKLGRRRDHFIFSVESTGQWDSDDLFLDAVQLLKAKCAELRHCLEVLQDV